MESQASKCEFSKANLRCWTKAIERFNDTLHHGDKKRIQLGTESVSEIKEVKKLFETAQNAKLQHDEGRKGYSGYPRKILKEIHKYAQVVDVFIQQQPEITAVIWGSIRFLIQVAVEEDEIAQQIGDALVDIVIAIGRWEEYLEAFSTSRGILERITSLYTAIVSFLVRTRSFHQKPKPVKYMKAITSKGEFAQLIASIARHSKELEKQFYLEALLGAYCIPENMSADLILVYLEESLIGHLDNAKKLKSLQKLEQHNSTLTAATFSLTARRERTMSVQGDTLEAQIQASDAQNQVQRLAIRLQTGWRFADDTAEPFEGTCRWLLEHEAFKEWVESRVFGILWIYGKLGCGKSVLAKFLYSHSPTSVTIIYHFRASVDLDSARPAPFAAFVISRILQQPAIGTDPRLGLVRDSLDDLSNRFKDDSRKAPFATLWSALLALVELVPPFTIIIDGLDECHFSNSRELDDFLLKLEHLGAASKTRIIALSRPYGKFEPYVARATLIAMDAKLVDPDVIRFVDNQITMHRHLLPIRERILERVRDGCQGMFIWAILLLQYLQDGYTPNIKIRRLQEFPVELHSVYESIWTVASSRLDSETLQLRHEVLLILLAARRPLTIDEICVTLALRPLSPKIDTEDLPLDPHELLPTVCWPLAEILNGNLQLVHLSAKEFLTRNKRLTDTGNFAVHMSHDDSNSYLARKCLIRLLEAQNQSPNRIAPILRRNVYPESALTEEEDLFLETTVLYDYAAANWHIHLTAIPNPDTDILYLAQDFLHGNQFVMWGEYTFGKQQDNSPIAVVESRLKPWHSNLPPSSHEKIEINDFFTTPYRALSDTYKAEGNDKTLQWLCLFRLGGWYMMAPDFEAANKVKKEVVEGLTKLLGKSNPLTLRATASLAQNYLILGKMRLAAETYLETSQIQLEVVGADRPDSFESLMWAASAQYYLTEYSVSATNQSQAAAGFWRILGPTSTTFLMSQLFYGYALVGLGELDPALAILEDIYKRRSEILGPDNGMGLHAQVALASVLRKIGSLDKAELNLSQAYEARVRIWGISDMNSIDTSIHLIIIYREARKPAKAQEYIDALSKPGILEEYFERYCQVNHLHALLQIDAGNYKRSRDILRNLLDKSLRAGLGSNNRSLLWARLTLSTILREHGKKDEASELFEDLVETIKDTDCNSVDSLDGEPQPPRLLEIAEEALRLVRARKEREAKQLLEDNRLKWKREEDFWIMLGGPAADTAWMRGP